jgi:hypothetical protein
MPSTSRSRANKKNASTGGTKKVISHGGRRTALFGRHTPSGIVCVQEFRDALNAVVVRSCARAMGASLISRALTPPLPPSSLCFFASSGCLSGSVLCVSVSSPTPPLQAPVQQRHCSVCAGGASRRRQPPLRLWLHARQGLPSRL